MIFRVKFIFPIIMAVLFFQGAETQNLCNGPENIEFDSLRNRYLISNYFDGSIIETDGNGIWDYFITGLGNCLGNQIVGDILHVSVSTGLIDMEPGTGNAVSSITVSHAEHTGGLAADTSGNLYLVDTGGRI